MSLFLGAQMARLHGLLSWGQLDSRAFAPTELIQGGGAEGGSWPSQEASQGESLARVRYREQPRH